MKTARIIFQNSSFKTLRIGITFFMFLAGNASGQVYKLNLDTNWLFRQVGTNQWLPAKVPGCVHTDLLRNNKIEDPFYGTHERDLQWIGEKNWEYKTTFPITGDLLSKERIELVFKGLDTYADVYLNDSLVLKATDMHRTWQVNCKPLLHSGRNNLRVYFHSVYQTDLPKFLAAPFELSVWPNNDQSDLHLSVYARKAGFEYGWDWGPRFITSGIWRPICIEAWNSVKIRHVQVIQKHVGKKNAQLTAVFDVSSTGPANAVLEVTNKNRILARQSVKLSEGKTQVPVNFIIPHPKLWWTNGLGEPFLYHLNFKITSGNQSDHQNIAIGIRTLQIVRKKDSYGESMYVKLNGVPVFMKGANYIPQDIFLTRVTPKKYESLIKSAAESHINMIRVWGGGTYEKNLFYDLCDQYGILVFQDMMFACGMYPADSVFCNNVSNEVTENVTRLRNHPCIALWCGNNENEISYYAWGWKKKYPKSVQQIYEKNMSLLFHKIVPEAIHKADTSRYYLETSPITGFNGVSPAYGDVHYYGVWKGAPINAYNTHIGRFMSEYGFQGFPDMKTIASFADSSQWSPFSPVMLAHQKAKDDVTGAPDYGTRMIENYMSMYFRKPKDFKSFVYVSQLLQAKAVVTAIRAHRRNMPYCMGSMYWQLDDCWPVISWSGIDYYGRWKALQYRVKHAFKDVMLSCIVENGKLKVYVVSDRLEPFKSQIVMKLEDFNGNVLKYKPIDQTIQPNASRIYFETDTTQYLKGINLHNVFLAIEVRDSKKVAVSSDFFFLPMKDLNLPEPKIVSTMEKTGNLFRITLKGTAFARSVYLSFPEMDGRFSDNYFDLLPNETKTIDFTPESSVEPSPGTLKIRSLRDTY